MSSKKVKRATPFIAAPKKINRRALLKLSVGAGIAAIASTACSKQNIKQELRTPGQTEGPFYPIHQQQDKDVDLTQIEGRSSQAKGKVIHIKGQVTGTDGKILKKAFVDIWQANTWGRYRHIRDPNRAAQIDPDFQGWGQTETNAAGQYGFKTILPGAYPAGPAWTRPPHIHFKVAMPGYHRLTTQMYFPDQELNNVDKILQNLPHEQQELVIARLQDSTEINEPIFIFNIVLMHKT